MREKERSQTEAFSYSLSHSYTRPTERRGRDIWETLMFIAFGMKTKAQTSLLYTFKTVKKNSIGSYIYENFS